MTIEALADQLIKSSEAINLAIQGLKYRRFISHFDDTEIDNSFQSDIEVLRAEMDQIALFTTPSSEDLLTAGIESYEHFQLQIEALGSILADFGMNVSGIDSASLNVNSKEPKQPKWETPRKIQIVEDLQEQEFSEYAEYIDSPSLHDLGLSKLGLGLLAIKDNSLVQRSSHGSSLQAPESHYRDSLNSYNRKSTDSNGSIGAPIFAPSSLSSRMTLISQQEYSQLSTFLTLQITHDYLNQCANEVNDLLIERQFDGSKLESFVLAELEDATKFSI